MLHSAVIYCRVSSPKQVKEGHGLESQEIRCKEYARLKKYEVIKTFQDDGITGGIIDRPAMQEMLAFLRKNKKEQIAVLIDDISRLARGLEAHLELRTAIAQAGGKLESPSIEFGDDSDSRLVENLLASVSQHQRQKNAEQVVNRMRARAMNGYWVACPITGYRYENVSGHGKMFVKDEPVASIVQEALEGFAYGRFSSKSELQKFLQRQPAYPKDRKGRVHLQRVENLLRRIVYAGYIHTPKWDINYLRAKHEPLISLDTWQRIQDRLDIQAKTPVRRNLGDDFPLRGHIHCVHCGRPMTSCWSRGRGGSYPYYFCHTKGCPSCRKAIRKEKVEEDFEAFLSSLKPTKQLFIMFRELFRETWEKNRLGQKETVLTMKAQVQALERQEAQFLDRIVETDNANLVAAYEKRIEEISRKKALLRDKLESGSPFQESFNETFRTAFEFLENPAKPWVSGDLVTQKIVLRLIFEGPLQYTQKEGFRTPLTTCPFRFFRLSLKGWGKGGLLIR